MAEAYKEKIVPAGARVRPLSESPDRSVHEVLLDHAPSPFALPHFSRFHGLQVFYGDLHNHTGYSDGAGCPGEALRQMRARGLHFAAITDHSELFGREGRPSAEELWAATAHQVTAVTGEDFIAIRGFEWSSPHQGHSNVWCSAAYTTPQETGDTSIRFYYDWLSTARPIRGVQVLAGFNHPGREPARFDDWALRPALDDLIVTLECFNRDQDYGPQYFQALDHGWHVGAIGVSDHHGRDWGNAKFPRAGVLAPTLTLPSLQAALVARRVFATRSATLTLLLAGNRALMGTRLHLGPRDPLEIGVWCHDPTAARHHARFELWTTGERVISTRETCGLQYVGWRVTVPPQGPEEHWFVVRVLHGGRPVAYSSPLWVCWG